MSLAQVILLCSIPFVLFVRQHFGKMTANESTSQTPDGIILGLLTEWLPVALAMIFVFLLGAVWNSFTQGSSHGKKTPPVTNPGNPTVDDAKTTDCSECVGQGSQNPFLLDTPTPVGPVASTPKNPFLATPFVTCLPSVDNQSKLPPGRICYNCGEKSHYAKFCPHPWKPDGRKLYRSHWACQV